MTSLSLEFLGSGTSVGVPVIGCDCAVCSSADPRNKRLRSSVLFRGYDEQGLVATSVVIDTSPDFRQQMLRSNVRRLDALICTHYHSDHVVGIDDVRRFNHLQKAPIDCWATPRTLASLRHSFGYIFENAESNVRIGLPGLIAREIEIGRAFQVGCLSIEPLELDHVAMPSLGLRVSCRGGPAISYCLDVKRIPEASFAALRGTHTLVLDMLREKAHPTHMNFEEALAAAARVGAQRTYFAHIAHEVDHATVEAKLPGGVKLACDGLVLEV